MSFDMVCNALEMRISAIAKLFTQFPTVGIADDYNGLQLT